MNLLFQFWIHTEQIGSLGFLEHILNTPSHHRVHHGRNPYCIDKNYAGVLIIWDRIFGTFQSEKAGEKIAYGLVHNIETFDPIYTQFFNYQYIIQTFLKTKGIKNKIKFLFNGPGWQPGLARLGDPNGIPEIEKPIKKYDPKVNTIMQIYLIVQYVFNFYIILQVIERKEEFSAFNILALCSLYIFALHSIANLFESKKENAKMEALRNLTWLLFDYLQYDVLLNNVFHSKYSIFIFFRLINVFSLFIFTGIHVRNKINTKFVKHD